MKKISRTMNAMGVIGAAALASAAGADVLTQWNFNSTPPDADFTTGSLTPNIGVGTAANVGGTNSAFASGDTNGGSTDPVTGSPTNDSGWQTSNYSPQGAGSGGAGIGFASSTLGYQNIIVSWDQRHSNTSSRFVQFQYSLDGSTFTSAGLAGDGIFTGASGDTWFNNRTVDLSGIAGAANNANFAFRIVAIFDPAGNSYVASNGGSSYAASGTWRFDMVTINGSAVPAPGAIAMLGLAGVASRGRRRR